MKSPPASVLLRKAAGVEKGAGEVGTELVGEVSRAQVEEIVELKKADLNARDMDHAVRIIAGTARSMGIVVEGEAAPEGATMVDESAAAPAEEDAPAEETAEEEPAAEEAPEEVKD